MWQPVTWLPRGWIASALVYQHLVKIVVAGLLFFRYLQLRRLHPAAAFLGALLLAFSAYMCMGSCWFPFADEVVCFAALLLGVERALQSGRWCLLAIAAALVGMINPFFLYLCALFLAAYLSARLYLEYGWQFSAAARISLKIAAVVALGAALGAAVTLPYLQDILNSPRGSGTVGLGGDLRSFNPFGLETHSHYATATLRLFANDLLGTGDDFRGWRNYLEAPLSYCGLISLLLLPQAYILGTRRARHLFIIFIGGLIIPTVFPWFRYLFWCFQGDYYRTYSLFGLFGTLIIVTQTVSRYLSKQSYRLWLCLITLFVLLGTLYLPWSAWQSLIRPSLRNNAAICLGLYASLLIAGQWLQKQTLAMCLCLTLVAVELTQFDRLTVGNRKFMSKDELRQNTGYNDETTDAVREIAAQDKGFYRVSKPRPSAPTSWTGLNDSMIFGYYGTSSYSSFNNVSYTSFLTDIGAIPPGGEGYTRWATGTLDYPLLSGFLCEKYALIDDPYLYVQMSQYRLVKHYGKDTLFYNQMSCPLGLTYTRYLEEKLFRGLPAETKAEALYRAAILAPGDVARAGLARLTVEELEAEIKTTPLRYVVAGHQESALRLPTFSQSRLTGTLQLDQKTVLVMQTAFDRGWHALVDDQPDPVFKVDAGLLGLALTPGEHKVELRYRNPLLTAGISLSSAALLILAFALRRWPRLPIFP